MLGHLPACGHESGHLPGFKFAALEVDPEQVPRESREGFQLLDPRGPEVVLYCTVTLLWKANPWGRRVGLVARKFLWCGEFSLEEILFRRLRDDVQNKAGTAARCAVTAQRTKSCDPA